MLAKKCVANDCKIESNFDDGVLSSISEGNTETINIKH